MQHDQGNICTRMRGPVGAVLLCWAALVGAASPGPALWPMGGQNLHNTRHAATEHTLGVHNVADLTAAWVFTTSGDVSATPAVDAHALYFPDWGGTLYKVHRHTGKQLWARALPSYTGLGTPGPGLAQPVSRTAPALHGNLLVLGSHRGAYILAVDKYTGTLLWKTQADPHPTAIITQSPVIAGGASTSGSRRRSRLWRAIPRIPVVRFAGV